MEEKIEFEGYISAFLLLVMIIVAFVNVVSRYLFNMSLAFTEEIEVAFFVWITFIGIGMAFKRGSHLAMVFVRDRLPIRKPLIIFGQILSLVLFVVVLFLTGKYVYLDMTLYHSRTMALGIPMWVYTIGMPIISILVIFRTIQKIREVIENG
ncbi:TRAP transporter small permease [Thermococcus sp. MV5]|uniref:TRAP transporter small permease n=1 Tax=Thermococcus sp. MV5 TaxID=1638272 RepID=UPI00143BBA00|nr:TRAP transporter small permease [Thermococcus sp. MV5]NJE26577.1 TRAP transporter small permease [Thermococcus sp. MV5]